MNLYFYRARRICLAIPLLCPSLRGRGPTPKEWTSKLVSALNPGYSLRILEATRNVRSPIMSQTGSVVGFAFRASCSSIKRWRKKMTLFSRKGHWRTSSLGNPYWVGEHDVSRDDWYRSQGDSEVEYTEYQESLRQLQEVGANGSATSAYTKPNAKCPVCGQAVFFYQNRWGSRVYFDDLGQPWPKHPCMDFPSVGGYVQGQSHESVSPVLRNVVEVQAVEELLDASWRNTQQEFWEKYGVS